MRNLIMPNCRLLSIEDLEKDDEFFSDFCKNCPAYRYIPATYYEPADEDCPASFQLLDKDCVRHSYYEDIQAAITNCNAEISSILRF